MALRPGSWPCPHLLEAREAGARGQGRVQQGDLRGPHTAVPGLATQPPLGEPCSVSRDIPLGLPTPPQTSHSLDLRTEPPRLTLATPSPGRPSRGTFGPPLSQHALALQVWGSFLTAAPGSVQVSGWSPWPSRTQAGREPSCPISSYTSISGTFCFRCLGGSQTKH